MTVAQLFGHDNSLVSESNFETVFGTLLEGVLAGRGYGFECIVAATPVPSNIVQIGQGVFCVGGVFGRVTVPHDLTIAANVSGNPRIDRIVLRRTNTANLVEAAVVQGAPAGVPTPLALARTGDIYEISLAQVWVADGFVTIEASDVWDERADPSVCGLSTGRSSVGARNSILMGSRQEGYWSACHLADMVDGKGLYGGTLGTGVTADDVTSSSGLDSYGRYLQQNTSNVANVDAALRTFAPVHRLEFRPIFICQFALAQIADTRFFAGLSSASTPWNDDDPAGMHLMGVQYSSARDTTWQLVVKDGATLVRHNTNALVDTNVYELRVWVNSVANAVFIELYTVTGGTRSLKAAGYHQANLPAAATDLYAVCGIETLTTAIKSIKQYYARGINKMAGLED